MFVACKSCLQVESESSLNFDHVKDFGVCSACAALNKKIERLREMADDLRAGKKIYLDMNYRDLFPVGNSTVYAKLVANEIGFAFVEDGVESDELDWFEWGQVLYIGPKSYNKFNEFRKYKQLLESMDLEDHDLQFFEEMDDFEKAHEAHFLAKQEIGFVFTTGDADGPRMDRWVTCYVGKKLTFEDIGKNLPIHGQWHVHELNKFFELFKWNEYPDLDNENIPKRVGVANSLEAWANMLESADRKLLLYFNNGWDYNEESEIR